MRKTQRRMKIEAKSINFARREFPWKKEKKKTSSIPDFHCHEKNSADSSFL